jgi:hypothetical protein
LEIVTPLDIAKVTASLGSLENIVTTGQKATDTLVEQLNRKDIAVTPPNTGDFSVFHFQERILHLYRMPSSSRAYPLSLEKKAEIYGKMFRER